MNIKDAIAEYKSLRGKGLNSGKAINIACDITGVLQDELTSALKDSGDIKTQYPDQQVTEAQDVSKIKVGQSIKLDWDGPTTAKVDSVKDDSYGLTRDDGKKLKVSADELKDMLESMSEGKQFFIKDDMGRYGGPEGTMDGPFDSKKEAQKALSDWKKNMKRKGASGEDVQGVVVMAEAVKDLSMGNKKQTTGMKKSTPSIAKSVTNLMRGVNTSDTANASDGDAEYAHTDVEDKDSDLVARTTTAFEN